MQKVLLATLFAVDNFGSSLQTYATCKLIEKSKNDVQVINYISPRLRLKNLIFGNINKKLSIKKIPRQLVKAPLIIIRKLKFNKFLKTNLNFTKKYRNYSSLEKNPPEADIYITGSDQVWNSKYNMGIEKFFYLDFAPENKKKIAFSASIGMNKIPKEEKDEMKKLLLKYDAISVRENRAKELLEELGIKNVLHVLDPTMLIQKEDWEKIASKKNKIKGKYLLIYQLNNNPQMIDFAKKIAKQNNLKLVKIEIGFISKFKDKDIKRLFFNAPKDFINLFMNASYIVTDSFHGTAFSINFNKQFSVVYPPRFSSRLSSVLEMFDISDRALKNEKDIDFINEINYEKINKKLDIYRKEAEDFLLENIKEK